MLRKRLEFANAEALEGSWQIAVSTRRKSRSILIQSQHHAKDNVFENQHAVIVTTWTHVARRRSEAKVENKDENIQRVTARDIRLEYALEELFESAGGGEYVPLVQPGADRPNTVEQLNSYT